MTAEALFGDLKQRKKHFAFGLTLLAWYQAQQRSLPWRERFASTGDPFAVWVSEIMLQQTTIQAVLPAYERFFRSFPDIYALAKADEESVKQACRGLGYYRRFRMMHQAAKELVARSPAPGPCLWPEDFTSWRELPGVGDYTAAAVSSIAFGFHKAVVDGNVERVFCRLFDLRVIPDSKWKRVFQGLADKLVPAENPGDFNQGLMELGQTVCTKMNPICGQCPVESVCLSKARQSQNQAPQLRKALGYEDVRLNIYIYQRANQLGLIPRSKEAKFLRGTLGFPTALEISDGKLKWESPGQFPLPRNEVGRYRHSITKHRIEACVHFQKLSARESIPGLQWVDLDDVDEKLVSNLDRKALRLHGKHQKQAFLQLH